MSRQTKFDLTFPNGFKALVVLQKSSESKTVCHQGVDGRQVRTIKVLTVDDVKPAGLDDIESLVEYSDLKSYYPYRDESGETVLIEVDKKALQALYKSSNSMLVQGTLDQTELKPHMFDNGHYFVQCQVDSKSKTVAPGDQQMYTIIYHYLLHTNQYLLVKFISANREKFAVLYPDPASHGMRMSILLHSSYQRSRTVERSHLVDIVNVLRYGHKLFGDLKLDQLDPDSIIDDYESKLKEYIEQCKNAGPGERKITLTLRRPVTTEPNLLDALMSLA